MTIHDFTTDYDSNFEKLRIIGLKAIFSSEGKVFDKLNELNQHMKVFIQEKEFDSAKIRTDVDKGRQLINALSEML